MNNKLKYQKVKRSSIMVKTGQKAKQIT